MKVLLGRRRTLEGERVGAIASGDFAEHLGGVE